MLETTSNVVTSKIERIVLPSVQPKKDETKPAEEKQIESVEGNGNSLKSEAPSDNANMPELPAESVKPKQENTTAGESLIPVKNSLPEPANASVKEEAEITVQVPTPQLPPPENNGTEEDLQIDAYEYGREQVRV